MAWVTGNIQIILVVCGILTASMLLFAAAPGFATRTVFGATPEGAVAEVFVRGWGLLVALTGGMLLWAAFHPEARTLAVGVALISKIFYMGQLVAGGGRLLKGLAGLTVVIDLVMAVLLATWMWAEHGG